MSDSLGADGIEHSLHMCRPQRESARNIEISPCRLRDLGVSVLRFVKKKIHHGAALLVFDAQITKCNSPSAKNKGFFRELLRRPQRESTVEIQRRVAALAAGNYCVVNKFGFQCRLSRMC